MISRQGVPILRVIMVYLVGDTIAPDTHYENTPIQIYRKVILQKFKIFR